MQLELFALGTTPQARRRKPEPRAFYAHVMRLRRAGYRVYRAGYTASVINGKRCSNAVVARFAGKFTDKGE